ncbi:MAG: putative collagen-binding domain-containing protein, partial [Flavitalea sp.]
MDSSGSYVMIYLPQNKPVSVDLSKISGSRKNVSWFNPRSGKVEKKKKIKSNTMLELTPPTSGTDWVLVIDDASKKFPKAGTPLKN